MLKAPRLFLSGFDLVFRKMGFRTSRSEAVRIASVIRGAASKNRVVYLDGDDDLCVQWPEILPFVDLYVKKHLFRDRSQYQKVFVGKTNLTDYVHHHFGQSFADDPVATTSSPVPETEQGKLVVGWNLALDAKIVGLRDKLAVAGEPPAKDCDVVCRAGIPKDWIGHLRSGVEQNLRRMDSAFKVVIPNQRVSPDVYLSEMLRSRICVSPFGYGEICWRDFEAVLCNCLLVKPDMGHVETFPDIFRPHETYVPVKWDLSDLAETCTWYLEHEEARQRVVANARATLESFYENGRGFIGQLGQLLGKLSLNGGH